MSFAVNKHDNYTIINFTTDKLDAIVAPDLKSELVIINKQGEKNIIVDLAEVKYCDSSGLSALLIGHRLCKEAQGLFMISSIQPNVEKLLSISQLLNVLNIKDSLPEAIDALFEQEID
ncbi:MAG: STAS domain-containing protein [Flavobacteriales bacterium]|nr:STAS domain-containing protein [Flavobacteriales bacterium]